MELTDNLIEAVIGIARQAGQAIMAIYQGPLEITVKADESPLTQADKAAHHLIVQALHNLTRIGRSCRKSLLRLNRRCA